MKRLIKFLVFVALFFFLAFVGELQEKYKKACIENGDYGIAVIERVYQERTALWWVYYDLVINDDTLSASYSFRRHEFKHANIFFYDERDVGRKFKAKYCKTNPWENTVYFDQEIKD